MGKLEVHQQLVVLRVCRGGTRAASELRPSAPKQPSSRCSFWRLQQASNSKLITRASEMNPCKRPQSAFCRTAQKRLQALTRIMSSR